MIYVKLLAALVLGSAVAVCCVGCMAVGALASKAVGPDPIPAKFVPPKEPTLVLVENFQNPSVGFVEAEQLARYLDIDLKDHKVVPTVDLDELYKLRDRMGDEFSKWSTPQIGRAVQAKQVIYVDLMLAETDTRSAAEMVKGKISVRVRVVSCANGDTLWPKGSDEGYPVDFETPYRSLTTTNTEADVRQQICEHIAGDIAKLFYKWQPDEEDIDMK